MDRPRSSNSPKRNAHDCGSVGQISCNWLPQTKKPPQTCKLRQEENILWEQSTWREKGSPIFLESEDQNALLVSLEPVLGAIEKNTVLGSLNSVCRAGQKLESLDWRV